MVDPCIGNYITHYIGGRATNKADTRQPAARFNGLFVCHAYNESTGCKRDKTHKGCKNNTGMEFAHVCNYRKGDGDFCLTGHERWKNHK